jgi:type III restriction enzyme
MNTLKEYQETTLTKLTLYLQRAASDHNVVTAYEQCTLENFGQEGFYNNAGFPEVPYVCLRLPTGGGKTLLAAYSIPIATKEFLGKDFSLALWLVPSSAILEQTLKALQDVRHWYRQVLNDAFDGNINILTVEDALYLTPSNLQGNTCVIISTLQAWRQKSTEGRKVYQDNGSLKQHFDAIPQSVRSQLQHFDEDDGGTLKHSLANLVYVHRPALIIDEAHNARTPLTFETLQRLNPSCIVEFTATPLIHGNDRSNVLYNVSAATLKYEDIIKMPIELDVSEEWHIVIQNAVKKQRELSGIAADEEKQSGEYIRPIVLLQAEKDYKDQTTTNVAEVKKFLLESCSVQEEEIAIATGEKREIEGIDLSERSCRINFIITQQALKEGWDCPFAYIFASVAIVRSSKDVEQLLGRVLRMPNVTRKNNEALNHAYAFVYSKDFFQVANNLTDSLVRSGFTASEAENYIEIKKKQGELPLFSEPISRTLSIIPDVTHLPITLRDKIEFNKNDGTITIKKVVTEEECRQLQEQCPNTEDKQIIEQLYRTVNRIEKTYISPAKRGEKFAIPQLLLHYDGELHVFDEEVLLAAAWNLATCDSELTEQEFPVKVESGTLGLIDIDLKGVPVVYPPTKIQEELSGILLSSMMQHPELVHWLVKETRQPSVTYAQQIVFVNNVIDSLIKKRGLEIGHLVFMRVRLREAIRNKIQYHFAEAKKKGYQTLLFKNSGRVSESTDIFSIGNEIVFSKEYPVNTLYTGQKKYNKHFYELIGDMNGEEDECAAIIDGDANIEFWIRNLERQEHYSFWLQTSTDKFYPDFLVKLRNGIIVVVEYKGTDRYGNPDSIEKRQIGEFWHSTSGNQCRFVMLNGKDWKTLSKVLEM